MGAGAAGVCVLTWLIGLSWYDVTQRRLPNWLTVPGAVVILASAAAAGHGAPALAGAVSLFAIYLALHLIAPAAMGAGDVKLAHRDRGADRSIRHRCLVARRAGCTSADCGMGGDRQRQKHGKDSAARAFDVRDSGSSHGARHALIGPPCILTVG